MRTFASKIDLIRHMLDNDLYSYRTSRAYYVRLYMEDNHDVILRRTWKDLDTPLAWTEMAHIYPDVIITNTRKDSAWVCYSR